MESANCVHADFLGVFAQWPDLHNSFSEAGIKTSRTEHKNKQHYQFVRNSFLVNSPQGTNVISSQGSSLANSNLLVTNKDLEPVGLGYTTPPVSKQIFRKETAYTNWFSFSV